MKTAKLSILAIAAAVLSLSGGVAVALDAEGAYTAFDRGNHSCAKFLRIDKESVATSNYSEYNSYLSWIVGFMTAAFVHTDTQKSIGDIADRDGIEHLVREYCEENPLDELARAAKYVAGQLIDRAGRR